jgi:4-amino-4-deoxy-L-arabinose transferase-like glycosyltransferase
VVAAGAVLGLAFNIKLFQALIIAPSLVLLMLLAVDLPVRRRIAAFAGSLAAFGVVSLGWVATASLTPLSNRPWPIGSTNGSVWDVIFVFNGIDRLRGSASPAALKLDPPGALRFFGGAQDYVATVGTMLMAAVVFGAAALVAGVFARRRGARLDRLRVAGGVFLATWLVSGVALLSHMQRMQPRYLEAVTPAIAAVLGVGVARLAAAASSRLTAAALTVASAGVAATGILLTHAAAWAVVLAIAATVCCGLVAVAPDARGGAGALAVCALAAALAVPASAAVRVAAQHRSNAGLPSRLSPDRLATLSTFLRAHQGGAKYELVSPTVARAAPLIARDGRPVLMLTSLYGRPLIGPRRLRHLVATGQARYALLGARACTASAVPVCAPAVRWALAHSVDVGADAGVPRGMLYRLTTTPARPKAATVYRRKAR